MAGGCFNEKISLPRAPHALTLPKFIFLALEVRHLPERWQHLPRGILAVGIIILTKSRRECAHISTAVHRRRRRRHDRGELEGMPLTHCAPPARRLLALPPSPSLLQFSSGVELPSPSPSARRILGVWAGGAAAAAAADPFKRRRRIIHFSFQGADRQRAGAPATERP